MLEEPVNVLCVPETSTKMICDEEPFDPYRLRIHMDNAVLVQTCPGCPEQYDVFYDDEGNSLKIGYLRLRHGYFRADYLDCGGETVYEAHPEGGGVFASDSERYFYLSKAVDALIRRYRGDDE